MRLDLHVYFHSDDETARRLVNIESQLTALTRKGIEMSEAIKQAWETLLARVSSFETVQQSTITLLGTLKASLDAALAQLDPEAPGVADLQALSDRLGTDSDALAAAVVANTPATAAPAVPPADLPEPVL